MGRPYAGILGTVAFCVVVLQGWRHAVPPRQVLESAILSTMAFCAIGYAIGSVAGWIVRTSIQEHEIEALLGPFGSEPMVRHLDH